MAVICMLIAGILTALSNLCMRRCIDVSGSTKAFFVFQLLMTFIVVTLIYPFRSGSFIVSPTMLKVAFLGGLALGLMKVAVGKALEKGPSGLIFATVNSACIVPAIIISVFLSRYIDCKYTLTNAIGSLLVLIGLIWAGKENSDSHYRKRVWVMFAVLGFILHSFYLLATEWRLYLMKLGYLDTQWFVPVIFVAAMTMHAVIYLATESRVPQNREAVWGLLGGIFNGVCTFFFVMATEIASSYELPLIFPAFSVALIFTCNLWGQWLYSEDVNWYANATCLAGVALGTIA